MLPTSEAPSRMDSNTSPTDDIHVSGLSNTTRNIDRRSKTKKLYTLVCLTRRYTCLKYIWQRWRKMFLFHVVSKNLFRIHGSTFMRRLRLYSGIHSCAKSYSKSAKAYHLYRALNRLRLRCRELRSQSDHLDGILASAHARSCRWVKLHALRRMIEQMMFRQRVRIKIQSSEERRLRLVRRKLTQFLQKWRITSEFHRNIFLAHKYWVYSARQRVLASLASLTKARSRERRLAETVWMLPQRRKSLAMLFSHAKRRSDKTQSLSLIFEASEALLFLRMLRFWLLHFNNVRSLQENRRLADKHFSSHRQQKFIGSLRKFSNRVRAARAKSTLSLQHLIRRRIRSWNRCARSSAASSRNLRDCALHHRRYLLKAFNLRIHKQKKFKSHSRNGFVLSWTHRQRIAALAFFRMVRYRCQRRRSLAIMIKSCRCRLKMAFVIFRRKLQSKQRLSLFTERLKSSYFQQLLNVSRSHKLRRSLGHIILSRHRSRFIDQMRSVLNSLRVLCHVMKGLKIYKMRSFAKGLIRLRSYAKHRIAYGQPSIRALFVCSKTRLKFSYKKLTKWRDFNIALRESRIIGDRFHRAAIIKFTMRRLRNLAAFNRILSAEEFHLRQVFYRFKR